MKKNILLIQFFAIVLTSRGQVLLNEVYTDPGAGKNEFFELYNGSIQLTPLSLDSYTLVTFFETSNQTGFCVMDLPNLSVNPKGYFVGSSALPFNYQGISNATTTDFSWNSAAFTTSNGFVKKWLLQTNNLADGNPDYDEIALPADFNDFFERRTGTGASFTIFLYKDGMLVNALSLGTGGGGGSGILSSIVNMPPLFIDMSGTAQDFWIDFSSYATVPVETVGQDGGSDNGFIREADGLCDGWNKSSSQVQHTPQQTNGYVDAISGVISTTAIIQLGTIQSGSSFIYDVISAPSTSFPVELQAYKDNGSINLSLDGGDEFVESNIETVVTDGPFTTNFSPYDMNMLLVVVSNAGCIDKVLYAISTGILEVKLIYFTVEQNNNISSIKWKVSENEAVQRFELQRSVDGRDFTTAISVSANSNKGEQAYQISENMQEVEKVYYRLKIINRDQKTIYSNVISINNKKKKDNSLVILGNPVTNKLNFSVVSSAEEQADIHIYNVGGQVESITKCSLAKGKNFLNIPLPVHSNKGVHIVEVKTGQEKFSARFVIQ